MVGSIATVGAVVAAVALTFTFGARVPQTDEAALRAIVVGGASGSDAVEAAAATLPLPASTPGNSLQPTTPASPAAEVPTATSAPTVVPPTSAPVPTAALLEPQVPAVPTPVATTTLDAGEILRLPAGRVSVPIGNGVSFELFESRDSINLPGISAIYVSEARTTEVDIFRPVATASGQPLTTIDDVVTYIENDPLFASLERWASTSWNGLRTIGYFGTGTQLALGFYTDPASIGDTTTGWRMPGELEIWFIDTRVGPIAVSSESLVDADPDDVIEAIDVMLTILDTIEIVDG